MKLSNIPSGLMSRWRNLRLRLGGMQIDGYAWLRQVDVPRHLGRIRLGKKVMLDRGVTLLCSDCAYDDEKLLIEIDDSVYINRNSILDAAEGIKVGAQSMIGPNCYVTDHDHQIEAGTAPGDGALVGKRVEIGERVWLGAGSIILKGVSIGDGTVIGAGSVVTKDLPANCVAVGNPAQIVRTI